MDIKFTESNAALLTSIMTFLTNSLVVERCEATKAYRELKRDVQYEFGEQEKKLEAIVNQVVGEHVGRLRESIDSLEFPATISAQSHRIAVLIYAQSYLDVSLPPPPLTSPYLPLPPLPLGATPIMTLRRCKTPACVVSLRRQVIPSSILES